MTVAPAAPKLASAPPVVASAAVSGTVTLAPDLAKRVAPNDNIFVFVRPAEGSRMPLALVRKEVRELPFRFVLDDSMAMAPGMNLSSFPQVVVGARVSKSGSATPQPGDFEGTSAPIGNTASNISVVIKNEIR